MHTHTHTHTQTHTHTHTWAHDGVQLVPATTYHLRPRSNHMPPTTAKLLLLLPFLLLLLLLFLLQLLLLLLLLLLLFLLLLLLLRMTHTRQALDLLPLFNLIPRKLWTKYPKPYGCLVVGLSPRSELPEFTKLVCSLVRNNLPDLNFTSIGGRVGGKLNAHKDMNTIGLSAVLSGSANRPCLFWCFSSEGSCFEEFEGRLIPRFVSDLSCGPLLFDAKLRVKGLSDTRDTPRVSVSAFSLRRSEDLSPNTWETLASLGFNIPKTHQSTLDCFLVNPRLLSRRSWPALNEHPLNQRNIQVPATIFTVDDSSSDEDDDDIIIILPSWFRLCDDRPNEQDK